MLEIRAYRGFSLSAAHLNHGIRGDEADRDEAFVRGLCAQFGVELICERARGLVAAMPNLEERARELRRNFLERSANVVRADFIALAHHADDQTETLLMRLLRGSGIAGLGVMAERGPGRIIRPMLSLSRQDIRAFTSERQLEFVEDSSNASRSILRNRIRHELMPMLEREYAPGIVHRLSGLAAEMRDLDALVATLAARDLESISVAENAIDLSRYLQLEPAMQRGVARELIRQATGSLRRVSREHIESVRRLAAEGGPNAFVQLPGRWRVRR
ncbi:MAG TPA: tRNA lysidine(34) synthetase TilS, partial [Candidatus Binataceae bacterium]|nr:tRNA lysidine(34) synthetase TilS [Candidatus Binataceae bacterium]